MRNTLAATLCTSVCGRWGPATRTRVTGGATRLFAVVRALAAAPIRELTAAERIVHAEDRVVRQPLANRLVHWLVALSALGLFFTGFGQLPLYKRYMLADLPGLGWTADYGVTLLLHYLGAAVLTFAVSFHLAYHGVLRRDLGLLPRRGDVRESIEIVRAMLTGGKEPPSAKYLAEQRLAYAAIGGSIMMVVLTGLVKVAKNLPSIYLPEAFVAGSTHLHNLAAILLLLAVGGHLLALLIPANRKLVAGIIHGCVDRCYVQHRHPIWYRELLGQAGDRAEDELTTPGASTCTKSTRTKED